MSAEKWIDGIDRLNMGIYSLLVILLSYKIQGESSKQTKLLVLFGNVPQRGINGRSRWVVYLTAAPLRLNSQTISLEGLMIYLLYFVINFIQNGCLSTARCSRWSGDFRVTGSRSQLVRAQIMLISLAFSE